MGKKRKSVVNDKKDKSLKKKKINGENYGEEISTLTRQAIDSILNDSCIEDSRVESKRCFEILLNPILSDNFNNNYLEKKLLVIRRNSPVFQSLFSTQQLDEILRNNIIKFTENLDVVRYINGKRETLNQQGRACAPVVWKYFQSGCSIRLLNPQTYCKPVWKLLSLLQEHFSCMAGANVYLTPAGTQGFAPHWDDIDAFVLQVEGRKKWRIYSPRSIEEQLPRYSSEDLKEDEIGDPIFEGILEQGDVLYFPRGYIHQACSTEDSHSLHLTVSVNQKNAWTDFLHAMLPLAVDMASEENVELRESLPSDYFAYVGAMHSELGTSERSEFGSNRAKRRTEFISRLRYLLSKVLDVLPVDAAADQMCKNYLAASLPPWLSTAESSSSTSSSLGTKIPVSTTFDLKKVKLIRASSVRIVSEDRILLCHNLDNSRLFEGNQSTPVELTEEEADRVERLIETYPGYLKAGELGEALVSRLAERGFLVFKDR